MKTKIILPDKYTNTIINIAKKDGLLGYYDFGEVDFVYKNEIHRKSKKIEQQLYQLLFLYDEVVLTDFEFELYDTSKLTNLGNITYLNIDLQNDIIPDTRINHIVPSIDYDFSQYIKPAIIHEIKRDMKPLYKIKADNFSDYKFASIYYDMLFSDKEQKQPLLEKYAKIYDINAAYYHNYGELILGRRDIRPTEFNDIMLAIIARNLDQVLRDFELVKEAGVEILNPSYSVEKLGLYSRDIETLSEIYGTLKVECNRIIPVLPGFDSISDVLRFKERRESDIRNLRQEIDNLEDILKTAGKENMIKKASDDVKKAAKALNKGEKLASVDKWIIFMSLPAGILEFYSSLPPILSIPLSVYGVSSYLKQKHVADKNNWIRIIR